jgi:hypothetical protein
MAKGGVAASESLRMKHLREIALLRKQQQFEDNERKRVVRERLIQRACVGNW